jgi:hypothetical protein
MLISKVSFRACSFHARTGNDEAAMLRILADRRAAENHLAGAASVGAAEEDASGAFAGVAATAGVAGVAATSSFLTAEATREVLGHEGIAYPSVELADGI